MSLRIKTALIIGATFLSLIIVLYFVSHTLLLDSFENLGKKSVDIDTERLLSNYSNELNGLSSGVTDWAKWDDTYSYMKTGDANYITSNMADGRLSGLNLSLMVLVDTGDKIVYGRSWDATTSDTVTAPSGLQPFITGSSPLVNISNTADSVTGIIMLPEGPMLVASHNILTSTGKGPSRGYLIWGRYLNAAEISKLESVTHLTIAVENYGNNLSSDFMTARSYLNARNPVFIRSQDNQTVSGYTLINDIFGQPAVILRVDMPRDIFTQGISTINYLLLALGAIGIIFAVVMIILIETLVQKRLSRLSSGVQQISATSDLSRRIATSGDDEISHLAKNINGMLDTLQISRTQLSETQNYYRTVAENIQDGLTIVQNKKAVFFNQRIIDILGYSREKLSRMKPHDFIAPEEQSKVNALFKSTTEIQETSLNVNAWIIRFDGTRRYTHSHISVLNDEKKSLFIITTDITEQWQAEDALRSAAQKWRTTFDGIRDAICLIDPSGKMIQCNQAFADLADKSFNELIGNGLETVFDQKPHLKPINIMELIKSHKRQSQTMQIDSRWFNIVADPILDGNNALVSATLVISDISARHSMEEDLRNAAQKWRATFDSIGEAICLIDTSGKIRQCNQAFADLTGKSFDMLIGNDFREMFDQVHHVKFLDIDDLKKSRKRQSQTLPINSRWFNIVADPVLDENDQVSSGTLVFSDITVIKSANEKLQKAIERETELRRELEAEIQRRVEFTRALVHELKTPLTPVLASSELLTEELKEEPWHRLARNIHMGAVNLNQRTDELLDLARGEIGMLRLNAQPVFIEHLLVEVIDYMQSVALNNKQTLKLELSALPDTITADEDRLRQVLFNLIGNALKFTPTEGTITLKAYKKDGNLVVEVRDTGVGIDGEQQKRLFQPYQRLEPDREHFSGLGLGLALSKNLIELHGGRIWVDSHPGVGSTFIFTIPIAGSKERYN